MTRDELWRQKLSANRRVRNAIVVLRSLDLIRVRERLGVGRLSDSDNVDLLTAQRALAYAMLDRRQIGWAMRNAE